METGRDNSRKNSWTAIIALCCAGLLINIAGAKLALALHLPLFLFLLLYLYLFHYEHSTNVTQRLTLIIFQKLCGQHMQLLRLFVAHALPHLLTRQEQRREGHFTSFQVRVTYLVHI